MSKMKKIILLFEISIVFLLELCVIPSHAFTCASPTQSIHTPQNFKCDKRRRELLFELHEHQDVNVDGYNDDDYTSIWLTPVQILQYIENIGGNVGMGWTTMDQTLTRAKASSLYADVAYYHGVEDISIKEDTNNSSDQEDNNGENLSILSPSLYRLNPRLLQQNEMEGVHQKQMKTSISPQVHQNIQEATERTYRWCEDFVQYLNLCPWAKLSLQSANAIRIKIMHQDVTFGEEDDDDKVSGLEAMEQIIRESALELMDLTENYKKDDDCDQGVGRDHGHGHVDANVGITFVIAIPTSATGDNNINRHVWDFEFEQFYDFCINLEDQLLDEAEEYENEMEQENIHNGNGGAVDRARTIGDDITIAPFHPDWSFASSSSQNPLDYEKKAPYPTISLVRSSVIIKAGEEATGRIGIHNEELLQEYGSDKLEELYQDKVLRSNK